MRRRCSTTSSVVRLLSSFLPPLIRAYEPRYLPLLSPRTLAESFVYRPLIDCCPPAVVLAPFFAHLEILFSLGYRPQLHHDVKASVGVEIARIRRLEAEKRREKAKKAQ